VQAEGFAASPAKDFQPLIACVASGDGDDARFFPLASETMPLSIWLATRMYAVFVY
jgi:hypothetical protein